ncbi:hypothetical protein ABT369_28290 [Dactylosporangium sp. NPDC000244]|uniref:hypothetical protein n=1 Tax=Dactylosporangium sp. NPDC000244 TaxID=3154365 RepID=UPI00332BF73C
MKRAWQAAVATVRGWWAGQDTDPWEHGRETLHQPHIPQALQDMLSDADETVVLDGPVLLARQPGKRRLKRTLHSSDLFRSYTYRGVRRAGRDKAGVR